MFSMSKLIQSVGRVNTKLTGGLYDGKSDLHDMTDWSTDYMLCKTYCATVLYTVLMKYKYL